MPWGIPPGAELHLYAFLGIVVAAALATILRITRGLDRQLRPVTVAGLWLAGWTGFGLVLRMIGYA